MSQHYIQYHAVKPDNPVPTQFSVRTKNLGEAAVGDIVWLLVGTPAGGHNIYQILYWFQVDSVKLVGDQYVLAGTDGEWITPPWLVNTKRDQWFDALFNRTLGRGSFGFRPVPSEHLPLFLEHQRKEVQSTVEEIDGGGELGDIQDEIQRRAIRTRRGQTRFRAALLAAYNGRCMVTGSRVQGLLEAAHITPHAEGSDYRVSNGLLLRADLHTLFDLDMLGIDQHLRVHLATEIRFSEYARHHGQKIDNLPDSVANSPSPASLQQRFERFLRQNESPTKA